MGRGVHRFGGDWTSEKLERVRKYLCAYTRIFASNVKASYYRTTFVDAFAGTGSRIDSAESAADGALFAGSSDKDATAFKKGSARIALEVEPGFSRYVFIERDAQRAEELERLKDEYEDRASRIEVESADANEFLSAWCRDTNWRRNRAVVFLDPYGMQVDWNLISALGATRAVDLWLLFPLGPVNRLLTRKGPEDRAGHLAPVRYEVAVELEDRVDRNDLEPHDGVFQGERRVSSLLR